MTIDTAGDAFPVRLTDERLRQIARRLRRQGAVVSAYRADIECLLDEVEVLRRGNAALREGQALMLQTLDALDG